jgi:hypothetical protein
LKTCSESIMEMSVFFFCSKQGHIKSYLDS